MNWCCSSFQGHFENAGRRGLSVFFISDGPRPMFVLQVRAVEGNLEGLDFDGPISLVTETGIQFCPWCGRSLMPWYKQDLEALTKPGLKVPTDCSSS